MKDKIISLANIAVPKVELKNVHFGYSREWGPKGRFDCDVWINGIKCMKAIDEGNGGCIDYEYFTYNNPKANEVKANIKLLEDYIKTLPPDVSEISGKPFTMPIDMDLFLEQKLNELEKQKADKKMQKLFATAIVFGVPKANSYSYLNYRQPLTNIPKPNLQREVDNAKVKYCKGGVVILNDNLTAMGINI